MLINFYYVASKTFHKKKENTENYYYLEMNIKSIFGKQDSRYL